MPLDRVTTVSRNWARLYNEFPNEYDEFAETQDTADTMRYLREHVDLVGKIVLDIGGGTGRYSRLIAPKASKVYCFDPCQPLLDLAAARVRELGLSNVDVQQAEAQAVPLVDESVDIVLAVHSISAIAARDFSVAARPDTDADEARFAERARAIDEMLRVLRPGGWLFSLTPAPSNYGGNLSTVILGSNDAEWSRGKRRFLRWMSDRYGFVSAPIRGDWHFNDPEHAARVFGFVYGHNVADYLRRHRLRTIENHLVMQALRKPNGFRAT